MQRFLPGPNSCHVKTQTKWNDFPRLRHAFDHPPISTPGPRAEHGTTCAKCLDLFLCVELLKLIQQNCFFIPSGCCWGSLLGQKSSWPQSLAAPVIGRVRALSSCCPLLVLLLVCSSAPATSRSPDLVLLLSSFFIPLFNVSPRIFHFNTSRCL